MLLLLLTATASEWELGLRMLLLLLLLLLCNLVSGCHLENELLLGRCAEEMRVTRLIGGSRTITGNELG